MPNNIKFDGTFVNNERNGKGILILQNGTKCEGYWENN